jgi:hypothetical protein
VAILSAHADSQVARRSVMPPFKFSQQKRYPMKSVVKPPLVFDHLHGTFNIAKSAINRATGKVQRLPPQLLAITMKSSANLKIQASLQM